MIEIDISRVIFTIINFLILYLILRYFLFKPVNNVLAKRENDITNRINRTKENEKNTEEFRIQSEKELKNSKHKGREIVENYKLKAESVSAEIIKEASSEAELIMTRARVEADREREKVKHEIKSQVIDLALLVSSKALEEAIDEEKHKKLIEDFIAKVGI